MKNILLTSLLILLVFGQISLFAMNVQDTILLGITDISGPKVFKYTLVVPYYKEQEKVYVLFDDLYNEINKQHDITNAQSFNFIYTPDGREGVDYEKGRIFLNFKSSNDILVIEPYDNV